MTMRVSITNDEHRGSPHRLAWVKRLPDGTVVEFGVLEPGGIASTFVFGDLRVEAWEVDRSQAEAFNREMQDRAGKAPGAA